jgi:pimeloyl-ACP methyl ester carboxylesterase
MALLHRAGMQALFLLFISFGICHAASGAFYGDERVSIIDEYSNEQGYYIFYADRADLKDGTPVVFVHGYGALNPMIYGKWIRHLTGQGHPVIYPRYQQDLLLTSPRDFVSNTTAAIQSAMEKMRKEGRSSSRESLYLLGHSYGGVIIANLAANWRELEIPEPKVAMLCEPGSGPLNGGVLETYDRIDSTMHMVIVVGDNDMTVGQDFGRRVYDSAVKTPNRVLLWQYACSKDSCNVSASHYEPYAIDEAFDNRMDNFTSRKAVKVARFDQVDQLGYWKVFDMLVTRVKSNDNSPYDIAMLEKFADLGSWPDGSPLRKMDYKCPSVPGLEEEN